MKGEMMELMIEEPERRGAAVERLTEGTHI